MICPCLTVFPDNPRPIRTIRAESTNEEIIPSSSQEADVTTDAKIYVEVQYEAQSVVIKVRLQKTFASLFKTACNHFNLDKETSVFPHPLLELLLTNSQLIASSSSRWWRLMEEIRLARWSVISLRPWVRAMSPTMTYFSFFPTTTTTELCIFRPYFLCIDSPAYSFLSWMCSIATCTIHIPWTFLCVTAFYSLSSRPFSVCVAEMSGRLLDHDSV